MTEKQLAANRRNALKSTGPKTPSGKKRASRNSLKHGILASPVVAGLESREAWEEHLEGVRKSIAPVGALEELLTLRLATVAWKLKRIERFETEVTAAELATVEQDLENSKSFAGSKPPSASKARTRAVAESSFVEKFKAFARMVDDEKLDQDFALKALQLIREQIPGEEGTSLLRMFGQVPENRPYIPVLGIPDDEVELHTFDAWTAGLLRHTIKLHAVALEITPETLVEQCLLCACEKRDEAARAELRFVKQRQHWKLLLRSEKSRRMLLQPDLLDKVSRYGSSLERSFFKTLYEIQKLQAIRAGALVALPALLDLDVKVHRESSNGPSESHEILEIE